MILGHENEKVEFKKPTGELSDAMKSISAMLNKNGSGVIYFGIKNNGEIIGQQISDSTIRDISRKISETIKPTIFPIINVLDSEGKKYIEVIFSGNERPYSCDGSFYIRVADENKKISIEKLGEFFESLKKNYSDWENQISDENIDDVSQSTMKNFMKKLLKNGRKEADIATTEMVLEKLGLISSGRLNNAGKFLFSKNNPVKLKLAVFASDKEITFIDQNPVEGNILDLIDIAIKYINQNIRWRSIISVNPREEIPEIPMEAVKEVVINCFAHAKYAELTTHEISITPNKVSIYNPGKFTIDKKPEDFAYKRVRSIIKNPLIANALFQARIIEAWGTGFKRIFELCNEHAIKISYINEEYGFEFTFFRKNLTDTFSVNLELDDDEQSILMLMSAKSDITVNQLSERINKSKVTIIKKIKRLKSLGLVRKSESTKKGDWIVKN